MHPDPLLTPVAPSQRIAAMDVVRGFALLGILLMNIEAMVGPLNNALTGLDPSLTGADRWADALIYLLVQGKFYTLFSLLFGMGFAVMMTRAEAAGRPFTRVYLRRTVALLAIGLAHALLIWSGDILVSYALLAFVLLLFGNTASSELPTRGITLYLVPSAVLLMLGGIGSLAQLEPSAAAEFNQQMAAAAKEFTAEIETQRRVYGSGSYLDAVALRSGDFASMMGYLLVVVGWQILGLFVLGMWFVRSGAIARPQEFPRLYARLRWVALPIGLLLMVGSFVLMPNNNFSRIDLVSGLANALASTGGLLISLGYLGWIVRGLQSPTWARKLGLLAPAGRMTLTHYLAQSIVCTLLFYGYGLGWFEQLPRAWQVPFCLALFALQVALSHWWLARFRYGPMEWLWRAFTYGQRPPMRLEAARAT